MCDYSARNGKTFRRELGLQISRSFVKSVGIAVEKQVFRINNLYNKRLSLFRVKVYYI